MFKCVRFEDGAHFLECAPTREELAAFLTADHRLENALSSYFFAVLRSQRRYTGTVFWRQLRIRRLVNDSL